MNNAKGNQETNEKLPTKEEPSAFVHFQIVTDTKETHVNLRMESDPRFDYSYCWRSQTRTETISHIKPYELLKLLPQQLAEDLSEKPEPDVDAKLEKIRESRLSTFDKHALTVKIR